MGDDLRPRGTAEVQCQSCSWHFWLDPLDARLSDGPLVCDACRRGDSSWACERLFAFVPFATPEAVAAFPPPPLGAAGYCCEGCMCFRGAVVVEGLRWVSAGKYGPQILCASCAPFAAVPYANADALERFKPPPIGRCLCSVCWAPNEHASWADARAAGWYAGTGPGPEGWGIVCPDCCEADVDPPPR